VDTIPTLSHALGGEGRTLTENIAALPMHDGIMVQHSARHRAKGIMEEEAMNIAGVRLLVAEKVGAQASPPIID